MSLSVISWVGGKSRIAKDIIELFPHKIKEYHEPFVGSGSLMLNLLYNYVERLDKNVKITINDYDSDLVLMYKTIKDNKSFKILLSKLKSLENKYNLIPYINRKKEFYRIRDFYNFNKKKLNNIDKVMYYIFLVNAGFNGSASKNKDNHLIISYGEGADKKPKKIVKEYQLFFLNYVLNKYNIQIFNEDYSEYLKKINIGRNNIGKVIYFDPPYDIEKSISSYVGYNKNGFNRNDQEKLFTLFNKLKCYKVLSNSNTSFIRNKYKNYKVKIIDVSRIISRDKNTRNTKNNEVIISV